MNIRKYEAFVRAVELGSLSKAAEELGYTQSGISHMMQSLEEEVGFPLLVRTSAGIQPNHEGELLLPVRQDLHLLHCLIHPAAVFCNQLVSEAVRCRQRKSYYYFTSF